MVRNDGVILGAHCNCTARLGECCSHVTALLFQAWQYPNNHGREEEVAVTSKKCECGTPSEESLKGMEYQQGKDIIFNESQRSKREKCSKGQSIPPAFPPLTPAEQAELYRNLSMCYTQEGKTIKPAVLSIVREYAASYVPKAVMLQLQDRAETWFEHITVTKEQVPHFNV